MITSRSSLSGYGKPLCALTGSLLLAALALLSGCRHASTPIPAVSPVPSTYTADSIAVKFTNVSVEAGLDFIQHFGGCGQHYFIEQVAAGATVVDANGDGYPDLFFPQPQPLGGCTFHDAPWPSRLYLNDGKGHFTLAPANAIPDLNQDYGLAAAAGDYDNDGKEDLFVCCYGKSHLLHNRGDGTFEDVTDKSGIKVNNFCTGAVWFDADGDGKLDLYVLRYCDWSLKTDVQCLGTDGKPAVCDPATYTPATNLYFHNNGNGTFTEMTLQAGFGKEKRRSLGVVAADFDGDGKLDLFISNDLGPNYLFHNLGNGKFEDISNQAGVAYGTSGHSQANMGVAVGDYNNTGKLSPVVTTFSNEPYTLYRNDGGYFTDVSAAAGVATPTIPYLGFGAGFLDTRNQGTLDLFFANGHVSPFARLDYEKEDNYKERNQLLLNDGKGRFTEDKDALPADDKRVHRGAVFADFNSDGRMDVLTTATDDRPTLLRNDTSGGNWLLLRLITKYGCATPTGTRCEAAIGGKTLLRTVIGGGSYGGDSDKRVHFGLGKAAKIDTLTITWLSGAKQVFHDVPANGILTLREGGQLK